MRQSPLAKSPPRVCDSFQGVHQALSRIFLSDEKNTVETLGALSRITSLRVSTCLEVVHGAPGAPEAVHHPLQRLH